MSEKVDYPDGVEELLDWILSSWCKDALKHCQTIDNLCTKIEELERKLREASAEIKRLEDGIYSMCLGTEEQARKEDPVEWLRQKTVHIDIFNEGLANMKKKGARKR